MMTVFLGKEAPAAGAHREAPPLHVELARPKEVIGEVDDLFRRSGRDGFAGFSRRSYGGAGEWATQCVIARDAEARVLMHLGLLPRAFRSSGQGGDGKDVSWRAALVVDLITDAAHQDFWSPIAFVRQAVDLLRTQGRYDFLYTDPGATSFAVMRTAGFSVLASLSRFVFPLVPGPLALLSAHRGVDELHAELISWSEGLSLADRLTRLIPGRTFFVQHSEAFLNSRSWSWMAPTPDWVAFRRSPAGEDPVALMLAVPIVDEHTLSVVDLRWDVGEVALESVLYGAAMVAREQGFRKLCLGVLNDSNAADTLRRCGFLMRGDDHPVLTRLLRDDVELPPASEWTLTWLDVSAW